MARAERALGEAKDALKFVVHFISALHQPLHNEDNGDKGGNSRHGIFDRKPVTCTGSGTRDCWSRSIVICRRSRRSWRKASLGKIELHGRKAPSRTGHGGAQARADCVLL